MISAFQKNAFQNNAFQIDTGAVVTGPPLYGAPGAGGLIGYRKKRPSDTFVRKLSDLDPKVEPARVVETNYQTENVRDDVHNAIYSKIAETFEAIARKKLRERLEAQAKKAHFEALMAEDEEFLLLS